MSLASIQRVTAVTPIEGAERIECLSVLGYKTVAAKGTIKAGEQCILHEPDCITPDRPEYEFLRKQGFRIKVARFKGQYSQGLALPMSVLPLDLYVDGQDVTDLIGIKKYEKPIPAQLAGVVKGQFPAFLKKTDEPNLRSYPEALNELLGRECVITQKIDGTSVTYYLRGDDFGVCSRNLELAPNPGNTLWRIAEELNIHDAMSRCQGNVSVQGEVYGDGIQGNPLGIKGQAFAAFNLFDIANHCYLNDAALTAFGARFNVPLVTVVRREMLRCTLDELIAGANLLNYENGKPCEGIVIRPVIEAKSNTLPHSRLSVKVISERYALKHGE